MTLSVVAALCVLAGAFITFTAALGIVRFPTSLDRLHPGAKPQVLGLLLTLIGAALTSTAHQVWGMLLITAIFAFTTSPVISHKLGGTASVQRERFGSDHKENTRTDNDAGIT